MLARSSHPDRPTETDHPQRASERAFGYVFAAVALLAACLSERVVVRMLSATVAASLLAAALWRPAVLALPNRLWSRFGLGLSKFTQPLLLAALFFLVITPIGLLARLFRRQVLSRRPDRAATSYWTIRPRPGPGAGSMSDPF